MLNFIQLISKNLSHVIYKCFASEFKNASQPIYGTYVLFKSKQSPAFFSRLFNLNMCFSYLNSLRRFFSTF